MPFTLKIICKEVRYKGGSVAVPEGTVMWPVKDEWGTTTQRGDAPARFSETWETRELAERFSTRWKPHPWWVKPKSIEVVEIIPVMELKQVGWSAI